MAHDQRTRYQGVYVRHQNECPATTGKRCTCRPGYMARVWDRSARQQLRSPTLRTAEAAKNWRTDTLAKLDRGELPDVRTDVRTGHAVERFITAAREGKVLTKHGRRYKPRAIENLEGALMVHVVPVLGAKRLGDVRRGDVQRLVDDLAATGRKPAPLSGSRVRSVVNALRSLYRWAQDRDQVSHDPASRVRLPAMNATPRDRVAAPPELFVLLDALEPQDAIVYALAAFATARRQEIRLVRWSDVDFDLDCIYLGVDERGSKSAAAQRTVPLLRPLRARLRAEQMRQGQPANARLVCPPRKTSASGLLAVPGVARRAATAWDALGMRPIGLHECRHTAASWMNAAGVDPKTASALMGHSTPGRAATAAAGAAGITLERYTHMLPGSLERAREQLDAYLSVAQQQTMELG